MKEKSFTLIELLVVMAIIALIASVTLTSLKGTRQKARTAGGLQFSHNIHHALGAYGVGVWNFGDSIADGEVTDVSGYNNYCDVIGAVATTGVIGDALYFDGINDYVNCGNPEALDITGKEITLSAWMNLHSWPSTDYAPVVSKSWNYIMRIHGPGKQFSARFITVDPPPNNCLINSPAELNTWYHMALTYNGSIAQLYVNGNEVGSANLAGNVSSTNANIFIGRYGGNYFNGIIDEVRIYNIALTAGEIQKHYAEGLERHKLSEK